MLIFLGVESHVQFRPLSRWQEPDCICCGDQATQEAAIGNCAIRCCEKENCKTYSESQAEEMYFFLHPELRFRQAS